MNNDMTTCRASLTENGFEAFIVRDRHHAREVFFNAIYPAIPTETVSWGDSMTLSATGVLEELERSARNSLIKTFEDGQPWKVLVQRRREALLTDLFLTGANAVTMNGAIVNLDMIGNRTAAITFGPKKVVLFAGRNKIVSDIESARERIKTVAAPRNAARHAFDTPCAKTLTCTDCASPQKICNSWSIIEKCFPKGRIKVILIDEDIGL